MLTEVGRVVALEADSLWVETIRRSTCGTCAAEKGCGHGLLNKISDGKRGYIRVLPGELAVSECSVDDEVLISIPEEVILRGSFVAYMLPLFAMIGMALAFVQWLPGNQDVLAALGAIAGLVVGFSVVRWHGVRHRHDPGFQPTLVQVLHSGAQPLRLA